jgi:hypothetical protein
MEAFSLKFLGIKKVWIWNFQTCEEEEGGLQRAGGDMNHV